jgi:drug/metabolite transporter (DMT)-like permease
MGMLTDEDRAYLARATRTMQIIVGALAGGVLSFFGVALVLTQQQAGPLPAEPMLTYIAIVGAFVALVMAMIFPGIVIRNQRQAILAGKPTLKAGSIGGPPLPEAERELGPLVAGYQTALIIRGALLEGAASFCLVAYLLEGQSLGLVGAGVLLLFLLGAFPTRSKVEDAIEGERTTIEQLRQMEPTDAR